MSLSHVGAIKCSRCDHKQSFTFWDSINVSVDPKLKEQLTQGELTTSVCQKCGLEMHITTDCLYHDMGKQVAIWLRYSDQHQSANEINLRKAFSTISRSKCRIVRSFPDLIDKIRVFDDNFSDYLIDLLKLLTCLREGIDVTTPMYYGGLKRGESGDNGLVFVLRIDNKLYSREYPMPQCLEEPEAVMPMLTRHFDTSDKWPQVDRLYLLKALEKEERTP
jgi:hypothetical protein